MRTHLLLAVLLFVPVAHVTADDKDDPKPPTFKAPKDWKAEKASQFVAARFTIGEGDSAVSVTVSGLKGGGGAVAANVNRWRGQVGLKDLDDKEAEKALQAAKVDGAEGHSLDVTGPK